MTTLLVLYRRPEGAAADAEGDDDGKGADDAEVAALETLERRYRKEHMPLVARTPGLLATRVWRVTEALGTPTDYVLACAMDFRDRHALDAGLRSEPMKAAGRVLREIAPGLATFLIVEDAPDLLSSR
ncbi:MAG: Ethyl tert-butyl ether degradation EthD [Chloroflexi bacterium]|nr:Ethyl tert-butyl ether degradation EthD [Chloroflexota bacterium]